VVPPASVRVSRVPTYSTTINDKVATLGIPGYHRLWPAFPSSSARLAIFYFIQMVVASDANTQDRRSGPMYWLFMGHNPL